MQLQGEKHQRAIEGLERRFEVKLEEVKDSIRQGLERRFEVKLEEVKDSIHQVKTQQDQLYFQQEEIQNVQKQLISRQDQIFQKQDQIQGTLALDPTQKSFVSPISSIASWSATPLPRGNAGLPSMPTLVTAQPDCDSRQQSNTLDYSDVFSSDIDLESLLSLDWELPPSQVEETKSQPEEAVVTHSKTQDQGLANPAVVMYNNRRWCNEKDVGKLAVVLARDAYFGEEVLSKCTPKGRNTKGTSKNALDANKLSMLLSTIHADPAFSKLTKEEFSKQVKPKIITAIGHRCKYLRGLQKK